MRAARCGADAETISALKFSKFQAPIAGAPGWHCPRCFGRRFAKASTIKPCAVSCWNMAAWHRMQTAHLIAAHACQAWGWRRATESRPPCLPWICEATTVPQPARRGRRGLRAARCGGGCRDYFRAEIFKVPSTNSRGARLAAAPVACACHPHPPIGSPCIQWVKGNSTPCQAPVAGRGKSERLRELAPIFYKK